MLLWAQVLLSICSLLTDPNPDDPLVPEIAHMCGPLAQLQWVRWVALRQDARAGGGEWGARVSDG